MHDQAELNIICPIKKEAVATLREKLAQFDQNLISNRVLPFDKLNTIHFARWVILEATTDLHGEPIAPQLLLALDVDGDCDAFLEVFVGACKEDLCPIYECCLDFPANSWHNHSVFVKYLQCHHVKTAAGFSGHPRRSLIRIYEEDSLRNSLQSFLDGAQEEKKWVGKNAVEIHKAIQDHMMAKTKFHWVFQRKTKDLPIWRQYVPEAIALSLVFFLGISGLWPYFLMLVVFFVLNWIRLEKKHPVPNPFQDQAPGAAGFQMQEDHLSQNQMTSLTYIKPGWFYLFSLKTILCVVNLLARYKFVNGHLQGISGIHFARWMIIDNGRRLLFISNFDGSWQSYLGDFIDQAALGLSAIWMHTAGFPSLTKKPKGGAWDELAFKAYARSSQVLTQLWYSAYKRLSVENVNQNSSIRRGVAGVPDEQNQEWMKVL